MHQFYGSKNSAEPCLPVLYVRLVFNEVLCYLQVAVMKENIYSWAASSRDVDSKIFIVEMHDKNGDPLTSTEKFSGKATEK